jgi:hypothetical protein
MWWLWIVGPLAVAVVYALTGGRDRRRELEIERWREQMARVDETEIPQGYRGGKAAKAKVAATRPIPRLVRKLPDALARMLGTTGGGEVIGFYELVPKLAYLAVMGGDAFQGSDHVTVLAKLDEPSPSFTVCPLPIIEGKRITNTGVQFKKDAEFMALFLVERSVEAGPTTPATAQNDKAIRTWLSPPLREALLDFPAGWLRVDGKTKTMAFTLYGPADADRMGELISAADIVFAEYGAGGGPSLVGSDDVDDEPPPPPPPSKKKSAPKSEAAKR